MSTDKVSRLLQEPLIREFENSLELIGLNEARRSSLINRRLTNNEQREVFINSLMTTKQRRELVMFALDPEHRSDRQAFINQLKKIKRLIDESSTLDIN